MSKRIKDEVSIFDRLFKSKEASKKEDGKTVGEKRDILLKRAQKDEAANKDGLDKRAYTSVDG